jgi:hypothetical protein
MVGASGAGDGVYALFARFGGAGVGWGGHGEGEKANVGFFELAVDLFLACCNLLGGHQVCLRKEDDDVC